VLVKQIAQHANQTLIELSTGIVLLVMLAQESLELPVFHGPVEPLLHLVEVIAQHARHNQNEQQQTIAHRVSLVPDLLALVARLGDVPQEQERDVQLVFLELKELQTPIVQLVMMTIPLTM
jgi:hypothetical protein